MIYRNNILYNVINKINCTNMEDRIKFIVEKLIRAGIDMNAFLKASGLSIQEKIVEVNEMYCKPIKKSIYKRKPLRY